MQGLDRLGVLVLYYQRMIIQPVAETAVLVLKLYYQRPKTHPVVGDGRSSIKVVLPEKESPCGCRRRSCEY